jgi:enterochelin esterase-like enzyme
MTRSSVLAERDAALVSTTPAVTHNATTRAALSFRALIARHRTAGVAVGGAVLAIFVAGGFVGVRSYVSNFLTYRGFAAPKEPAYVTNPGTTQRILVPSPALGNRKQEAYVYLPSGYAAHPNRRYAVLYLLHGFPGRPLAWLETVRMGIIDDSLSVRGRAQPLILVMPFGSTGTFTDREWADGAGPGNGWATFVSRDLVHYVDAHYRTIRSRDARAIGGLSEGGYGAINIELHNPTEFSVVESWSGYERPDRLRPIFGAHLQLLSQNDPQTMLPHVATELRRLGTYFWFYSSTEDKFRKQNLAFAQELTRLHLDHRFFLGYGGHNWALWRKYAQRGYLVAAQRLVPRA